LLDEEYEEDEDCSSREGGISDGSVGFFFLKTVMGLCTWGWRKLWEFCTSSNVSPEKKKRKEKRKKKKKPSEMISLLLRKGLPYSGGLGNP